MIPLLLAAALSCGFERSDVKQLRDQRARSVSTTPEPCTIDDLVAMTPPVYQDRAPRSTSETRLCTVKGEIVAWKAEAGDNDLHVVLSNGRRTMVIEAIHPDCIGSGHVKEAADVRRALVKLLGGKPSKRLVKFNPGVAVTVTGIIFFDKVHGQTGVAPSGIELHPLTRIEGR